MQVKTLPRDSGKSIDYSKHSQIGRESQDHPGPPYFSSHGSLLIPVGDLPAGESVCRGPNYHIAALSGSNSRESATKNVEKSNSEGETRVSLVHLVSKLE